MTLREIADSIGIGEYPEAMEQTYATVPKDTEPACDLALIDRLQREHALFDSYYDVVRKTAQQINADEARSTWVKVAGAYALAGDASVSIDVPVPVPDGTLMTSMLPLFVMLPGIPVSIADYRRRGFGETELAKLLSTYWRDLRVVETQTGLPGLNRLYYRWLNHYVKAEIFNVGGLNFALSPKVSANAVYLRSRETGQVIPLAARGRFDATGTQRVGVVGFKDETDAFEATFREDADAFYGHGVYDCVVSRESAVFLKDKWECICRPGDQCLNMHIPKGADISPQAVETAIASARKLVAERYPEFTGTHVVCSSWLLNPNLAKILGPDAKITQFQNMYHRYPQGGGGKAGFDRIFGCATDDYASLPENTRLQRGVKQHYLNGGYIYSYAGMIV